MIGRKVQSKVVLHLSKPWDLGEALGWSSLPAVVGYRDGDRWLVELERPFRFCESEYRFFVVSPRLEGWQLSDAASCEVPCSMTPTTRDRRSSTSPCDVPPPGAGTAIIGSVTQYH